MKRLLLILGMLCCASSAAQAGPNAGGVLVVHDGGELCESCTPVPPPTDCWTVDNEAPLITNPPPAPPPSDMQRLWTVYAAFPAGSSPRLLGAAWGIQFPENTASAYSYVNTIGGMAPNEGSMPDFVITSEGFPTASGSELGHSFDVARTTTVVACYIFWGFGYTYDGSVYGFPTWCAAPHSNPLNRLFVDDATPRNTDPIMGYGCLGFGTPGYTPCSDEPDPTGACCNQDTGACTITTPAACPFTWMGEGTPCNDATCLPPVPTERTSWGRIKTAYR